MPIRPGLLPLLLLGATLGLIALTFRPVVEGDGVSAYAYLHTLIIDNDLNMSNEFAEAIASGISYHHQNLTTSTATGLTADFTPVGATLLSAPAYVLALALQPGGEPVFGGVYTAAYTLASLFYGLLGLVLVFALVAAIVRSRRTALASVAVLALASPLFYYLLLEPSYTHTFSEFVAAAYFVVWWRTGSQRGPRTWFALGLLGGLMGMIRFQDGPLAAVAIVDVPKARWRAAAWYVPGVILGFLPQLLVQHIVFGGWLPARPPEMKAIPLWPGHYFDVIFSSHNGVLLWAPVFLIAGVGLAFVKDRRLQVACVLAILIELVMMGSQPDWWGGLAFGPRRFLVVLPVFAVGLAALVQRLPRVAVLIGGLALVGWNLILVADFSFVMTGDNDLGYAGLLASQVRAVTSVPHIFAAGGVVRDLFLWPFLGNPPDPLAGLGLFILEAAILLGVGRLAYRLIGAEHSPSPVANR